MDDQQLWNLGTTRIKGIYAGLPDKSVRVLTRVLYDYQQNKESLAAVVAGVGSAAVCSDCRGQCCLNGKYRISVLDYLARLIAGMPTPADFAQKPVCPYGTCAGCTMEPGLRPADCVVFICDAIDLLLTTEERQILESCEHNLSKCCLEASALAGVPMGMPLLIWAGTDMVEINTDGKG